MDTLILQLGVFKLDRGSTHLVLRGQGLHLRKLLVLGALGDAASTTGVIAVVEGLGLRGSFHILQVSLRARPVTLLTHNRAVVSGVVLLCLLC